MHIFIMAPMRFKTNHGNASSSSASKSLPYRKGEEDQTVKSTQSKTNAGTIPFSKPAPASQGPIEETNSVDSSLRVMEVSSVIHQQKSRFNDAICDDLFDEESFQAKLRNRFEQVKRSFNCK